MPVADDWGIDYVNTEIRHIDGVLSYDANAGTAPALNDYVIDGNGAVGRIIAGSDLGGVSATGTLTLTNVVGRFANNATLRVLSEVEFDTVGGTPQGFVIGDTITGPTTESIDVRAIEYNSRGRAAGFGSIYGDNLTTGFANNEQLDVSGGATAVALVAVGGETDNSALFGSCQVDGPLAVPGTANTNNSEIVHFDAGSLSVVLPVGAKVGSDTTTANGFVQQTIGDDVTGSLRLIDSDTSAGAWTDGHGIEIEDMVFWNAQVAGEVFQVGNVYEGQTSTFRFRVLAVLDDGDNTGALITSGKQGGMTLNEDVHVILPGDVLGNKIAQVESTTTVLAYATLDIPAGTRKEQYSAAGVSQGGIYGSHATPVSLNIRRDSNQFFSYIKSTLALVGQLDDKSAIDGNVKDSLYTVLAANGWEIPDLSFRFLERGAWKDDSNNNVWTNYGATEALFTGVDITANGFQQKAANPRPMPDAYCEQTSNEALDQFWLEGPFDAVIKVKSTTDVREITPATPALGQPIGGGSVTWHSRPYGRLYSFFDNSDAGKIAPIVLANDNDADNNTGQYRWSFNTGGAGAFTVGEIIETSDGTKVGVVTASDSGATGDVDYVLMSDTQFVTTNVVVGVVSGKTATLGSLSNLVAGYGTNVRTMANDRRFTGGTTTVAAFIIGEAVTQATSGWTGFVLEDDSGTIYVQDGVGTAAPDATNQLTGATSGALNTPTGVADFTTVPKDLGEGSGDNNYAGVTSGDITGGSPQTIANVYEWDKFLNASTYKTTLLQGGTGSTAGVQGRFYRGFDPTFAEKPAAPYGPFAGGIMFAAEGHFIDKDTLNAADVQKIRVTPIAGTQLTPPNLQAAQITNLQTGWVAALYRSTGAASLDILTSEFQVGAGNAAVNTTIVLQAGTRSVSPTPSDVPLTGVLNCEDPSNPGIYLRFEYSSLVRSTNTYTLTTGTIGDVTGAVALTQGEVAFVAWISDTSAGASLSNTVQYIGDVETVGVARKKGFDDYVAAQTFISTGVNYAVNRTPDGVVNLP